MVERMEKNKYKTPILSDTETDMTTINPRMRWEQITEYIDLTYQKNLKELMGQGTDSVDAQISHHIKGYVIWALGPKAKYETIRGQWGRELRDISLQDLLKNVQEDFSSNAKCILQQTTIHQYQTRRQ